MPANVAPPFGFTPQQQEWYASVVPEVPEEAVRQILREWGFRDQEKDLRQEAYLGAAQGVRSFDPEKGPLRQWVFFKALHAAQTVLRREKRHGGRVVTRMWDGMIECCNGERRSFGAVGQPAELDRAALTEFCERAAAATLVGVAALDEFSAGEDGVVERAEAVRCADVLDKAVGTLSASLHELLRLRFAEGLTVKEVTTARGEKGYRAELIDFHRAVDLVAARLRGSGFQTLPAFPPDAGGAILRETGDEPSEGP